MGSAAEFDAMLAPLFEKSGLDVKPTRSGMGPSDHAVFHRAGTPVLFFFTGTHQDYHTPTDLPHKINAEGAVRVLDLVEQTTLALATRAGPLTFQQTSGPQMARGRAKVRLGVMPGDYSGDEPGVLVGEVYEGTSAAKAGILKGDRIVRWGGEELADAGVMMQRLVDAKPGDVVEVVVVREGKEVTLPLTLLAKPEGQ
jgi:predicted metalloprotease with PDZ domain